MVSGFFTFEEEFIPFCGTLSVFFPSFFLAFRLPPAVLHEYKKFVTSSLAFPAFSTAGIFAKVSALRSLQRY